MRFRRVLSSLSWLCHCYWLMLGFACVVYCYLGQLLLGFPLIGKWLVWRSYGTLLAPWEVNVLWQCLRQMAPSDPSAVLWRVKVVCILFLSWRYYFCEWKSWRSLTASSTSAERTVLQLSSSVCILQMLTQPTPLPPTQPLSLLPSEGTPPTLLYNTGK